MPIINVKKIQNSIIISNIRFLNIHNLINIKIEFNSEIEDIFISIQDKLITIYLKSEEENISQIKKTILKKKCTKTVVNLNTS